MAINQKNVVTVVLFEEVRELLKIQFDQQEIFFKYEIS